MGNLQYIGDIMDNKLSGYGEINFNNVTFYKGNFLNSKIKGIGELNSNVYIYSGQWKRS